MAMTWMEKVKEKEIRCGFRWRSRSIEASKVQPLLLPQLVPEALSERLRDLGVAMKRWALWRKYLVSEIGLDLDEKLKLSWKIWKG